MNGFARFIGAYPDMIVSEHTQTTGSCSFDAVDATEILESLAAGSPLRLDAYQIKRLTLRTTTTHTFSRPGGARAHEVLK